MLRAKEFLEDLQGLLIYLKKKNTIAPSIEQLLKKRIEEPEVFKDIFEEYKSEHGTVLENYFKQRSERIKNTYAMALAETLKESEKESDETFEKRLKEKSDYFLDLIDRLPTKFQELHSFSTVDHLLQSIIEAADMVGYDLRIDPVIGTVSNDSINAGAFTLESNEPIIIVDEDFLSFIHMFSKLFVQCLPLGRAKEINSIILRHDEIKRTIQENSDILTCFQDLLRAIIDGSPRKAKQYLLKEDERYIFCTYLMMSAELFMVGHEMGHILKHHKKKRVKFWYFSEMLATTAIDSGIDYEKEFEADLIGVHLSMQAMAKHGFQADFCYVGIELFFIVSDISFRAKTLFKEGIESVPGHFEKHPSNQKRIENIRNNLKLFVPENQITNLTFVPEVLSETMGYLWELSKNTFKR